MRPNLLRLLRPALQAVIRRSLPPELGMWAAALPAHADDGVQIRAELQCDGLPFRELDGTLDDPTAGASARARLGWSLQQATSFAHFQRQVLRAASSTAPLHSGAATSAAPSAPPTKPRGLFASLRRATPSAATSPAASAAATIDPAAARATMSLAALAVYLGRAQRADASGETPFDHRR